jgi:hypothetical protein
LFGTPGDVPFAQLGIQPLQQSRWFVGLAGRIAVAPFQDGHFTF